MNSQSRFRIISVKTIALFSLTLLAACSQSGSTDTRPALVLKADPKLEAQQSEAEARLAKSKLVYQKDYRAFSSDEFYAPCDQGLIANLDAAAVTLTEIEAKLKPQSELYRDDALDFSRKIEAQKASVDELASEIHKYCATTYESQKSCFETPEAILVRLNEHVARTSLVNPYLRLKTQQKPLVHAYHDDDSIRIFPREEFGQRSVIFGLTTPNEALALRECLKTKVNGSPTGSSQLATDIIELSERIISDTNTQCESLREKWKTQGLRSASDDENRFCGI